MLSTVSFRFVRRRSPPFWRISSITPMSAPRPALAMYDSEAQLTTSLNRFCSSARWISVSNSRTVCALMKPAG